VADTITRFQPMVLRCLDEEHVQFQAAAPDRHQVLAASLTLPREQWEAAGRPTGVTIEWRPNG
jgi:hypothetical protein